MTGVSGGRGIDGPRGGRHMEVHRGNPSQLLRRNARGECRYCGLPIEWFDRHDTRRIPLSPELPAARVPQPYQWYVDRGVAYPGLDPQAPTRCRMPHPAMCPALEHPDLPDELADLVARLAVRMRLRIERDGFVPALPPSGDGTDEPAGSDTPTPAPTRETRHTVHYAGALRLGPGPLDEVQCTADENGGRCPEAVYTLGEGRWEMLDLPHLPGRSGQAILAETNGKMWVWSLTQLDYPAAARWLRQRCPGHDDNQAPAACAPEWEDFHPLRHADFIVGRRPDGYEPARQPGTGGPVIHDGPRTLRTCAQDGCGNTTVIDVPDGWLCWRCSKRLRRRETTRRRWQHPGPPQSG